VVIRRVLHVAPHPDDELLGAPATLFALRDAGADVLNLCCTLGRAGDEARREAEVAEACRRAGFGLRVVGDPGAIEAELRRHVEEGGFDLVVSTSPHDRHPTHERVGRAVLEVLEGGVGPERWWLWGLWGELPFPTTVCPFEADRLAEIRGALEAHAGELARNDFRRLLEGRAQAASVLAAERVFGFGSRGLGASFAEVTTEVVRGPAGWRLGAARALDAADPFPPPSEHAIGWWLHESALGERLRRGG
jgi:LmbE family N-acetylglucosaminyl deacetylase